MFAFLADCTIVGKLDPARFEFGRQIKSICCPQSDCVTSGASDGELTPSEINSYFAPFAALTSNSWL